MKIHIDIETYSSVDLKTCGAYKYLQSRDFEILLIAYAYNDSAVKIIDLAQGEKVPKVLIEHLKDPLVKKYAHNAVFERQAFLNFGIKTPLSSWHCTQAQSAYCGLPLSLDMVSKVLGFSKQAAKSASGKALIKYFTMPCKPTKVNNGRTRNLPHHDAVKWAHFKRYCVQDVIAERTIHHKLRNYPMPESERHTYLLDQEINDRGIMIDLDMAKAAYKIDTEYSKIIKQRVKHLTGVDNPNSIQQLKDWMAGVTGKKVKSLAKDEISNLLAETDNKAVRDVLRLRQMLSKSSIKKYTAMINCACKDERGHGFFQFYGANRTGRWAGRLVQLQNLTKNYLSGLSLARDAVKSGEYTQLELLYGDVPGTLSQLIRTTFVAPKAKVFAVADFSAIEARVTAWLAGEQWRLDVFNTHGKIYEASAASMFNIPLDDITKGSHYRQKGKVAELALGYGGSLGALKTMGGEQMGLSENEMQDIVTRWRNASPKIVKLWKNLEACAKKAVNQHTITSYRGIEFQANSRLLTIKLPSGRQLFYLKPSLREKYVKTALNPEGFKVNSIVYWGMDQVKKQWTRLDTYGGKLTENVVQAIARDLLADAMLRLNRAGYSIVMHVHDEVVCEIANFFAETRLKKMCQIMSEPVEWAEGLPLGADGYLSEFYKKD